AHLHPTSELRISALVSGPGNERLEVVRRKKRKDSLRGADDAAIDESELARLLGGVDRASFVGLFKPRARTSRINAAVGAYRESTRRMREAALLPETWQEQAAELERLRRE